MAAEDDDDFWQSAYLAALQAGLADPAKVAGRAVDDWRAWQEVREVEHALKDESGLADLATQFESGALSKIGLIKSVRERYFIGLKDARDAVMDLIRDGEWPAYVRKWERHKGTGAMTVVRMRFDAGG